VIVPESNLAWEHSHIADELKLNFGVERPGNYIVMREDETRVGIKTNDSLKWAMTRGLDLEFEKRSLRFHREMFSVGTRLPPSDIEVPDPEERERLYPPPTPLERADFANRAREELVDQLTRWTRTIKPRKDPEQPPHIHVDGKVGGRPDDNALALMLCNTMCKRFHSSEQYRDYHRAPARTRA
jgi:hypothetical protein